MMNTNVDTRPHLEQKYEQCSTEESPVHCKAVHFKDSYEQSIQKIERLSWWMDESIRLPWGSRIGFDGIIGLIPGIGDISTMAVSAYIIKEARRHGAPMTLVIRMLAHVGAETAFGVIPVVGDLFDFYYKANTKNMKLLKKHLRNKLKESEKQTN